MSKEKPLTKEDKWQDKAIEEWKKVKIKPITCMHSFVLGKAYGIEEEKKKQKSALALAKKKMCLNQAREKGCPDYMQCSNCRKISECFQISEENSGKNLRNNSESAGLDVKGMDMGNMQEIPLDRKVAHKLPKSNNSSKDSAQQLIKCVNMEINCEYRRVASDYCDLNENEIIDCCPDNKARNEKV